MGKAEKQQAADRTDFDCAMAEFLPNVAERFCLECGAAVPCNATGRPKKFCSAKCRNLWWAKHPKPEHWSSARIKICPVCGKEFLSSRDTYRYCSHACANRARKGGGNHE